MTPTNRPVRTISRMTGFMRFLSDLFHSLQWLHPSKCSNKGEGDVFLCTLPSVGPGADPGVQAVSPQVSVSHPPGSRLPLLSARLTVTFPAEERHRPTANTKLYCLVTEAHGCEQLALGFYPIAPWPGIELMTSDSQVEHTNHYTSESCIAVIYPWNVTDKHLLQ